ncbi:MAG: hypothetical protein JST21_02380 [Bacteroidetes bacterium]|nr:hypothetical protein [Bacteroidota bacterium]
MDLLKFNFLFLTHGLLFCQNGKFHGCTGNFIQNINTTIIKGSADTITSNTIKYSWLALGDSDTISDTVYENERFPSQTVALLQKEI